MINHHTLKRTTKQSYQTSPTIDHKLHQTNLFLLHYGYNTNKININTFINNNHNLDNKCHPIDTLSWIRYQNPFSVINAHDLLPHYTSSDIESHYVTFCIPTVCFFIFVCFYIYISLVVYQLHTVTRFTIFEVRFKIINLPFLNGNYKWYQQNVCIDIYYIYTPYHLPIIYLSTKNPISTMYRLFDCINLIKSHCASMKNNKQPKTQLEVRDLIGVILRWHN